MSLIYLAEITAYDPAGPGVVTLRYATGAGYSGPGAPGYYEPRIIRPAQLRRTAFGSGTTSGAVETGYGELVLANIDGGLDGLIDLGLDGRSIRILQGDDAAAYGSFQVLFAGTMEQPRFTLAEVAILIRDRLFELDRPLQPTKFAGTNVLPDGLEGTDDIKGQPKPVALGLVENVAPPMVNTARLILQLAAGSIAGATLYDNGVALTAGAAYADIADMQANAPAAGAARLLATAGGSYARLGSSPAGQVTADITQVASAADRTVAQLLLGLATGPGGIDPADVVSADVTALDSAAPAVCGYWAGGEASVRQAMEAVAASAGVWFGFDRLGRLRMTQLAAPAGTPAATFTRLDSSRVATATIIDILEIERETSGDAGRGMPAYRVTVEYRRNHTVQTDGLGGVVDAARREFLRAEYRSATATDATVQIVHLLAPELAFRGLLANPADAQAEADRLLALYKVRRDLLRLRARLGDALAATLDLGAVVEVRLPRLGYGGGKLFRILGIETDAERGLVDFNLWG
ncbi:hypothetical protein [Falsiroseomonas selenitidurans]|uniref:Tail protein n=1 Tax=Falsiroseomonas selenitidurans TaxID=2716335 RepID=A0ABX1E360_9PROT|nr:hypothetical protein [Falsiroseomonas selenitidurans]NKC30207.1 hypothetical protein [Falsiroseomonas selenitidurans]